MGTKCVFKHRDLLLFFYSSNMSTFHPIDAVGRGSVTQFQVVEHLNKIARKGLDHFTQQTRDVQPMLAQCWPIVFDAGPTSYQSWLNLSCLLGRLVSLPHIRMFNPNIGI